MIDMVPKAIMLNLVSWTKESMQGELLENMYEAAELDDLMKDDWLARIEGDPGLFVDNFWTEHKSTGIVNKMRTWWQFGEHYLEPLIHDAV